MVHLLKFAGMKIQSIGYVINLGGHHGVDTKSKVYGVCRDSKRPGYSLCLVMFLGSLTAMRYPDTDVVIEG